MKIKIMLTKKDLDALSRLVNRESCHLTDLQAKGTAFDKRYYGKEQEYMRRLWNTLFTARLRANRGRK